VIIDMPHISNAARSGASKVLGLLILRSTAEVRRASRIVETFRTSPISVGLPDRLGAQAHEEFRFRAPNSGAMPWSFTTESALCLWLCFV
jgi:hypothetical protein